MKRTRASAAMSVSSPAAAEVGAAVAVTPSDGAAATVAPDVVDPPPGQVSLGAGHMGRTARAMAVIRRHIKWAAGAGVLPIPGVDLAAIAAVQLHLLADLADVYAVPFKGEAARSMIAMLTAAVVEQGVAGSVGSLAKLVPGIGTVLGLAVMPGTGAAATYALGRVFLMHFETGGTFLDFDPSRMEAHFRAEFTRAPR
jgi:uncharacterized protein (DUF697 family)